MFHTGCATLTQVSAHDRQRAQAFAPLYGDDYVPSL